MWARAAAARAHHARAVGIVDVEHAAVAARHLVELRPAAESAGHAVDAVHGHDAALGTAPWPGCLPAPRGSRGATRGAWRRWRRRSWRPAGCCRGKGGRPPASRPWRHRRDQADVGQRDAGDKSRYRPRPASGPRGVRPRDRGPRVEKARDAPLWVPHWRVASINACWTCGWRSRPRKLSEPKLSSFRPPTVMPRWSSSPSQHQLLQVDVAHALQEQEAQAHETVLAEPGREPPDGIVGGVLGGFADGLAAIATSGPQRPPSLTPCSNASALESIPITPSFGISGHYHGWVRCCKRSLSSTPPLKSIPRCRKMPS